MAIVRLSTPLRRFTGGKPEVEAEGATLNEALLDLEKKYPEYLKRFWMGTRFRGLLTYT